VAAPVIEVKAAAAPAPKAAPKTEPSAEPKAAPKAEPKEEPAKSAPAPKKSVSSSKAAAPAAVHEGISEQDQKLLDNVDKREHVNVIFTGHVDAGKSTIGGHLMFLTGGVDKRTLEKYEREAKEKNRESWYVRRTPSHQTRTAQAHRPERSPHAAG
jgi:peptide chain release factor subunit 3